MFPTTVFTLHSASTELKLLFLETRPSFTVSPSVLIVEVDKQSGARTKSLTNVHKSQLFRSFLAMCWQGARTRSLTNVHKNQLCRSFLVMCATKVLCTDRMTRTCLPCLKRKLITPPKRQISTLLRADKNLR